MLEIVLQRFPDRITVTPKEIADALGIDQKTVYQACKRERNPMPCVRLSKRMILIPISQFVTWMAERSTA